MNLQWSRYINEQAVSRGLSTSDRFSRKEIVKIANLNIRPNLDQFWLKWAIHEIPKKSGNIFFSTTENMLRAKKFGKSECTVLDKNTKKHIGQC